MPAPDRELPDPSLAESPSPSEPAATTLSRIVLLGFMGAGKSTVGALLASRLGWFFHDADEALEKRTGRSVGELFALNGEAGFRQMEAEIVAALLERAQAVIALGGGAIESAGTRSLIGSTAGTCTVFLDAPLETLLDRCRRSPAVRPLLQDRDALPARLERRLPYYRSAAITVNTEGMTAEAVVDVLMPRLMPRLTEPLNDLNQPQLFADERIKPLPGESL